MVRLLISVVLVSGVVATVRAGLESGVAFAGSCPAGTIAVPFTWEGAAAGTRAVWPAEVQDSGYSRSYAGGAAPDRFNATLTVDDPDEINEDGNNPIRAAYETLHNWDPLVPTRSNGAYGPGFLTVAEATLSEVQTLTFEFQFDRPVHIPDFRVGDIDFEGWGTAGATEPHDGYQDEVEMFGQRGGVPVTFSAVPGTPTRPEIVSGSKYKGGPYTVGADGDLDPASPAGEVLLITSEPVDSFGFRYSNGPDDASAESTRPTVSGLPVTGVSNNHAVRVDGFTVCVGTLTVGDLVFEDSDADGALDPGEPGIPGVTVSLTDAAGNVVATTVTDAGGNYTLDRLPPYDYVITVDQTDPDFPPSLTPSVDPDPTADGSTPIALTDTSMTNLNFGFKPPSASLAGVVYEDLNNDGIKDPDEGPIEGVAVTLAAADGSTQTATTGNDGGYLFANLPAGAYTLTETQPSTHLDGKDTVGSKGGTVGPDQIAAVDLIPGDVATGYNFGELPAAALGDFVWHDLNLNGVQDVGEPGIAGATVALAGIDDLAGSVNLTTTTDADGSYRFGQLRAGSYNVTFTTPAGYAPTGADLGGDDNLDSDGQAAAVTLSVGTTDVSLDSGFSNQAGLFGQVYVDANDNGVRDAGEAPVPGTTITVAGPAGTLTTSTAADGSYGFGGLPLGTYAISETQPAGYLDGKDKLGTAGGTLGNDTVTSIALTPGSATGYDFGELQKASLGNFVWEDLDGDGVQAPGEPGIAGVTVTLAGIDDLGTVVSRTAATDATGLYGFTDLRSGSYEVRFATPTGYTPTGVNAGGDDLVDSDGAAVPELLSWGENDTTVDSGFYRKSSIAGSVHVDADNDGVQDPGESAIPGATVKLSGVTGGGLPVSKTTTTDTEGNYSFTDLLPGTYSVVEIQPVGFLDGKDAAGSAGGTVGPDAVDAITLGSGTAALDYDFAELRPATIGGAVFEETLGNPTPAGQAPLAGVAIALTCTDDLGVTSTRTTTTAADGTYSFAGVRPGTCTISQTQPAGYQSAPNTPATEIPVTVTEGGTSTANHFGELRAGRIGNFVWEDLDGDGIQGTDEPGIAGVTVTLSGTDSFGASIALTDTTDAGGLYSFDELNPGSYTVIFTAPVGYAATAEDKGTDNAKDSDGATETVTLGSAESNLTIDSGFVRPASLGTLVWNDLDGDGAQDADEPGLPSVTVALTGTDGAGNTVAKTTITGADGVYVFDGLAPGSYTIAFAPPVGTDPSPADIGDDGSDSDGLIEAVTLESGEANTTVDSGFVLPASIAGSVYVDADDDAVFDPTETPIRGVKVTLTGTDAAGNPLSRSATTGADGGYLFDDLAPGTYVVTEAQPSAFLDGRDAVGSEGGTLGPDAVTAIALRGGDAGVDYDFGELRPAKVSGTVFEERTGSPDPTGQPGIPGVTLTLTCTDSAGLPTTQIATTGADGTYTFDHVRPGLCTITQTQPPGFVSAPNTAALEIPVTVGEGSTNPGRDFGELRTTSLGNFVWNDLDGDGRQDVGEPGIAGVTVTLTGGPVPATTTTDADGRYLFENLVPGTYTVAFTTPAGFVPTVEDKAADDVTDSDGAEATTTLASGQSDLTLDSGFYQPASLAGLVYVDVDDDGTPTSEAGIGGVTVTLTGTDGAGTPVIRTTTTGADGTYRFDDLPPGSYTVTETQPAGYLDGRDRPGSAAGTVGDDKVSAVTIVAGVHATGYTFGELPPASLGDLVWHDLDGNGIQDSGEAGIKDVEVKLSGVDDTGKVVTATVRTDVDGLYSFGGLRPGQYTVTFSAPAGYEAAPEDKGGNDAMDSDGGGETTNLSPGENEHSIDSGYFKHASIGGTVYTDTDNDGTPDIGEPGIAGVTVRLAGADSTGPLVERAAVTGSDGTYSFPSLPPGVYTLTETQPESHLDGKDKVGTAGGTIAPDRVTGINLGRGATATAYDFGELTPAAIDGRVFEETTGTPGIAGVTATLTGTDDLGQPVSLVTVTSLLGLYGFADLRPGSYTVTETQPAGYLDGTTTPASVISPIVLTSGRIDSGNDFGEVEPATVGNLVWDDRNGDGIQAVAEPGIAAVTVTVSGTDDLGQPVSATTTTAANGTYAFENLRPGTYTVLFATPIGFTPAPADRGTESTDSDGTNETLTLTSGEDDPTVDSGFVQANLSGTVYYDADHDGTLDVAESGIGGATIALTGTDSAGRPVELTTVTAPDGTYSFPGLPPGSYTVTETQPANFADGPDRAGPAGGTVKPDSIASIILTFGELAPANDFGEWGWPLSGEVRFDGSGAPIPGTKITVTGTNVFGQPVDLTTETGPAGSYAFTDLPPSKDGTVYTVAEVQPVGLADGELLPANSVVVELDQPRAGIDFTEKGSTIAGYVFFDANNNGTRDPDEAPIPDVEVSLTGTDAAGRTVQLRTRTDKDGRYSVTDLVAGTYALTETQPAGYTDGPVIPGSGGGEKGTNTVKAIAVGAGQTHTGYGFGETVSVGTNPPPSSTSTTLVRPGNGGAGGAGGGNGGRGGNGTPIVPGTGPLALTGAETQRLLMLGLALLVIGISWRVSLRTSRRREN